MKVTPNNRFVFSRIAAIVMASAVLSTLWAMIPSPNLAAGKPIVKNDSVIAVNIGTGHSRVLLYWYRLTYNDFNAGGSVPMSYIVQTSSNSTTGIDGSWDTVAKVDGNVFNAREHAFNFSGKSWVRMYSASDSFSVYAGFLTLEVHDISNGCEDTWFFMGNSITKAGFYRTDQPDFQANIHAAYPAYSPVMIGGGIGGEYSTHGLAHIDSFLIRFPDMKYWAIEYGMNDSWNNYLAKLPPFIDAMQGIITKIKAANRIPIISRISFGVGAEHTAIPQFNASLDSLVTVNNLIPGPDMYTYFQAHTDELGDGVHPNATGAISMNRLWAQRVIAAGVYASSHVQTNLVPALRELPNVAVEGRTIAVPASAVPLQVFDMAGTLEHVFAPNTPATWNAKSPGIYFVKEPKSGAVLRVTVR